MKKTVKEYSAFFEGIADFPKTGGPASYELGRSVDHRTDTRSLRLLPATIKRATTTDLIKWAVPVPVSPFTTYLYGDQGFIYSRDVGLTYTTLHKVDNSAGQGLEWFGVDKYIYYTSGDQIGRYGGTYGPNNSPLFYDTLFVGQNANTANTAVLSNLAALSQYVVAPNDTANQVTGDISLFIDVYFNAAVAGAASEALIAKWNNVAGGRSYILSVTGIDANNFTISLGISNDGTAEEFYTKNVNVTGYAKTWMQIGVTWKASTSTATFYIDAVSKGTATGAMTSIFNSLTSMYIGTQLVASTPANFFDGQLDNVALFSAVITNATTPNLTDNYFRELQGTEPNLRALYKFNNTMYDSTLNNNGLGEVGTVSFENRFVSTYDAQNNAIIPAGIDRAQYPGPRPDIDIPNNGLTGQTYTVPTAVSEAATDKLPFTPTRDPQHSMAFKIDTLGTGDMTLIIHDEFNALITQVYCPVGFISQTGDFEFVFPSSWPFISTKQYHAHLVSSVADTKVVTSVAGDLSKAQFSTYFAFLVNDALFHPIKQFQNFLAIGNDNYIATFDGVTYNPNAVTLDAGWNVRCMSFWNEYLAIGCWKGSNVNQFDQGRIFFWDGVNPFGYNFFIDVPEGAINAMVGSKGQLWFIAGGRCKLMVYEGGARAKKIKNLVNSESVDYLDIYPGAMNMWKQLLRFGVARNTNDHTVQQGVYTWGTINERFPESLSFDYVISTGNYINSSVAIGCVQAVMGNLLIGWSDLGGYGVDEVDVSNNPYNNGTIQFLIEDDDTMYHQKEAITVTTQFEPLQTNQSLTLKYKLDRADNWTSVPAVTTVGATTYRNVIALGNKRYREYEIALDIFQANGVSPVILAVDIEKDILETERRVG